MSLSSTTNKTRYNGDGLTTSFPVPFVFWDDDDVKVILRDANGLETTWTRGTEYTVTGGSGATGSVEVVTGPPDNTPAVGEVLIVKSDLPLTQPTVIPAGGKFPSIAVEQQFDQTVRQVQQMEEQLGRSLKFSEGSPDEDITFPDVTGNASRVLAVNSAASALELVTLASLSLSALDTLITAPADDDFLKYESTSGKWENRTLAQVRTLLNAAILNVANSFSADQTIVSTDAGAGVGPRLNLDRDSASPAASDLLGFLKFIGRNDAAEATDYAAILAAILDVADGVEDGRLDLQAMVAGTLTTVLSLAQGLFTPAATGGDQGADTINTKGFYVDGTVIPFQKAFTSAEQTITAAGALTLPHSLGAAPALVQTRLICKTAELGYSINDEVIANNGLNTTATNNSKGVSVVPDATNLNIRIGSTASSFDLVNKTTGAGGSITNANWRLIFRAWA